MPGCRARSLGRPEAVYDIVRDLAGLANKPDFQFGPAKEALTRRAKALQARRQRAAAAVGGQQQAVAA